MDVVDEDQGAVDRRAEGRVVQLHRQVVVFVPAGLLQAPPSWPCRRTRQVETLAPGLFADRADLDGLEGMARLWMEPANPPPDRTVNAPMAAMVGLSRKIMIRARRPRPLLA
jgi:hypothetical protein